MHNYSDTKLVKVPFLSSKHFNKAIEQLVYLTKGRFNELIQCILDVIDIEPNNIYLAGSRNGYKVYKTDSDLDLLMEFSPEDAKDICQKLEKYDATNKKNLTIKALITHAQFGRFFCCYKDNDPYNYVDLGIVTPEYLEIFLVGAPIMKLDASRTTEPSIERDYRQYIRAETDHLIIKARKAFERNNIEAALAHASRYHFLSGNKVVMASTVESIIFEAFAHHEQREL